MDFQQLRVFRAAARAGGFTRASETLHLSQSTISLHIKRLEEELGSPLFLRNKRRVYLNEAGRLLLQYADRVFQELKNAEMAVQELNELDRGTIRLGSGATTVTYLLPKILDAHQRRYPEIELVVVTGSSEFLAQSVHQQTLDLAVVMLPVVPTLAIEILPIVREELVFVISSSHPLGAREWLDPRDVGGVPFISFLQGSTMQNHLDKQFNSVGIQPRIAMELENIEAIKALVRSGLGMAVLPACSVAGSQGALLRTLRVRRFRMERDLALALPRSPILPRAIGRFASRITKGLAGKTVAELRGETGGS
ncbi:MAG: LysR family transcriptional regulator [Acidobacteriaceae bacterium]